ncbi:MAG: PIN domain-containing protein [Thermodesulfobacteriota bacterium]|nr:PIN domain-containing protein [Thermodesulfobacteriota bacterium]
MREIFIDTWAWCALINKMDSGHKAAQKANKDLVDQGYLYITSNFILDESYTLIRSRIGYKVAVEFGKKIKKLVELGAVKIIRITKEVEDLAWDLFVKYDDMEVLSFTDRTSFAVMREVNLKEVFTADGHFEHVKLIKKP